MASGSRRLSTSSAASTRRSSTALHESILSLEEEAADYDGGKANAGRHRIGSMSRPSGKDGSTATDHPASPQKHPEWNFYDVPKNEAQDPRWDIYWDTYGWGWKVTDEFRTTAEDYDSRFLDETQGGPDDTPVLRWEELTEAKDKCLAWLEQHVRVPNGEK